MEENKIFVTQPSLAPLEEYNEILKGIWTRGILTHNGPIVQQFEKDFCNHFGIKNMVAVNNGTIALQMAIKALGLKGKIITSPFTWIATVSAIKWEGCEPVFADIDPETLNIDPNKIEEKITADTVAIMPVHVFGNPCDIESIKDIADRYGLKVIYDAAHAVGSNYKARSVFDYGDISATSFHATKLLNTAEGGGCITLDEELHEKLKRIRFFGYDDNKDVVEDGFNGKMTEVNAALGLANLKYINNVIKDRKQKYKLYFDDLSQIDGLQFQKIDYEECNCSYFPVIFPDEKKLIDVEKCLNEKGIFPRRYFHPSVNTFTRIFEYKITPISEDIARRIICLPLYYTLSEETIDRIKKIIIFRLKSKST